MSSWSYRINGAGEATTFAAAGMARLVRTRASRDRDTVTFTGPGRDMTGAAVFAYGQDVQIYRDGDLWFTGRVNTIPRHGSGTVEEISWELVGPWYYLQHTVYQQLWKVWNADAGAIVQEYMSRVLLGQNAAGAPVTNGATLRDVLEYCLDSVGAKFAIGSIDPAVTFPFESAVDITCLEAMNKCLRWSPDCATWFDYSTAPPTFHCRKRSNLVSLSYNATGGAPVSRIDITPRYDLLVPVVALYYEAVTSVDGSNKKLRSTDIFPAGADPRQLSALVLTIELAGFRGTNTSQELGTSAIPGDLNDVTWWREKIAWLGDMPAGDITAITGGTRSLPALALPNEVKIGSVPDWHGKKVRKEKFTAKALIVTRDASDVAVKTEEKDLAVTLTTTDDEGSITLAGAEGNDLDRDVGELFTNMEISQLTEDLPVGVAEQIYASVSVLQWEGSLVLAGEEIETSPRPGLALNLTGGHSAWSTMAAIVSLVTENVDSGITTIKFGPPTRLEPADIITLQRMNRQRRMVSFKPDRNNADAEGSGAVAHKDPAVNRPEAGAGRPRSMLLQSYGGAGGSVDKKIVLQPETLAAGKLRKVMGCYLDGSTYVVDLDWTRAHP